MPLKLTTLSGFGAGGEVAQPDLGLISGVYETLSRGYGSSHGDNVSPSTTIHTKGSYKELTASSSADATGIIIMGSRGTGQARYLLDVAVGAAGFEVNIVNNLSFYANKANIDLGTYLIPINIPSGSRISARCQKSNGSVGWNLHLCCNLLTKDNSNGLTTAYTWGANTGDTSGVQCIPSATRSVKGSWAQITASTEAKVTMISMGYLQLATALTDTESITDIGIGGAGSEVVLIPDITNVSENALDSLMGPANLMLLPIDIPASSRLSVRTQANNASNPAGSNFDLIIYGYA